MCDHNVILPAVVLELPVSRPSTEDDEQDTDATTDSEKRRLEVVERGEKREKKLNPRLWMYGDSSASI